MGADSRRPKTFLKFARVGLNEQSLSEFLEDVKGNGQILTDHWGHDSSSSSNAALFQEQIRLFLEVRSAWGASRSFSGRGQNRHNDTARYGEFPRHSER
jgi:hypothetical protein